MTKESDDKLFIYKINKEKFFEVTSSRELSKRLEELNSLILNSQRYIIGCDTEAHFGYVTLLGVNPKLLDFNFTELTDNEVSATKH